MTTFHAFLGCSIDGFIAGPDDELDWLEQYDASTPATTTSTPPWAPW